MTSTGQQGCDPHDKAGDEDHGSDQYEGQSERGSRCKQRQASAQYYRTGRWPRHFDRIVIVCGAWLHGCIGVAVHRCQSYLPIRYTTVKTTTQTTSTKCQYQEINSIPRALPAI